VCRSQWSCGLRRGSTAARLLVLWVRIPPEAWTSVCVECCVLSRRGLCNGLVTRPEEVLPTVMRRCVRSRNLKNEEALGRVGPQDHRKGGGGGWGWEDSCVVVKRNSKDEYTSQIHETRRIRFIYLYLLIHSIRFIYLFIHSFTHSLIRYFVL